MSVQASLSVCIVQCEGSCVCTLQFQVECDNGCQLLLLFRVEDARGCFVLADRSSPDRESAVTILQLLYFYKHYFVNIVLFSIKEL